MDERDGRAEPDAARYGYRAANDVMAAWMNSPGHRANILNCSFSENGLGLGDPGYYWTQDFASRS